MKQGGDDATVAGIKKKCLHNKFISGCHKVHKRLYGPQIIAVPHKQQGDKAETLNSFSVVESLRIIQQYQFSNTGIVRD